MITLHAYQDDYTLAALYGGSLKLRITPVQKILRAGKAYKRYRYLRIQTRKWDVHLIEGV